MSHRRVRVGGSYRFIPVLFDKLNPPAAMNVPEGAIVTVVNLPGCPRANTGGMCHIQYQGRFAGMVCTNSLQPL
jgi:hypothetical protein